MLHVDATSLPRLMQCAASRVMPGFVPGTQTMSDDAREGIAAHWLANEVLSGRTDDICQWSDRKAPNGVYITSDLIDAVSYFIDQVRTRPKKRLIEHDMIAGGPAFGNVTIGCRPDFIADDATKHDRRIYIDDFKYGHRIIEPETNWTLLAYAFAYIQDKVIDPDTMFEFRIHQPRPYHPVGKTRVWIVNAFRLLAFREQMFAKLTAEATELHTGPHCYKCPARSNCPALRNVMSSFLDVVETAIPDQMTLADMSLMMDALTIGADRLKQYKEALAERMADALMRGESIPNYRMKKTEGALDWKQSVTPDQLRLLSGQEPVTKEKMITPKQAMKFIPESVIMTLAERRPGGLTMTRYDAQQLATELFGANQHGKN